MSGLSEKIAGLRDGIRGGDRGALARAITLVESSRAEDQRDAEVLLESIGDAPSQSRRLGISGSPGVGKSTLIEALGQHLLAQGERVAVLAVDPSSATGGGAILGDKTRMPVLTKDPRAFVRPSSASGQLGGVGRATRAAARLCEAAGYGVVLIETVGVGQSEVAVADMVDFFLVLALPRGGDELQGIKRGIMELADVVAVTKADGDFLVAAGEARQQYGSALRLMLPRTPHWRARAVTCSAITGAGVDDLWALFTEFESTMRACGEWDSRRQQQREAWMWSSARDRLERAFRAAPAVAEELAAALPDVRRGTQDPEATARRLVERFVGPKDSDVS